MKKKFFFHYPIKQGRSHTMRIFKVLKAKDVNLLRMDFLEVLKGDELKFAVCTAQKWPEMSQNREKILDSRHCRCTI